MRWSVQPYRPESWGWIPGGAQQSPPGSSNNHWPKCPQRGWKTKLRLFCMTLGSLGSPEQNTPFLEEPGGLWKLASSELQCRLLWLFDQSSVTWGYFQCRLTPVVHIELHEKGSQMNWFTVLCSVMSYSLWPSGLKPARLLHPWNFPGQNAGVGCYFLLQGIFLIQGWNPRLLHLLLGRWILCHYATYPKAKV